MPLHSPYGKYLQLRYLKCGLFFSSLPSWDAYLFDKTLWGPWEMSRQDRPQLLTIDSTFILSQKKPKEPLVWVQNQYGMIISHLLEIFTHFGLRSAKPLARFEMPRFWPKEGVGMPGFWQPESKPVETVLFCFLSHLFRCFVVFLSFFLFQLLFVLLFPASLRACFSSPLI